MELPLTGHLGIAYSALSCWEDDTGSQSPCRFLRVALDLELPRMLIDNNGAPT
jgi:hypothetical protein